MTEIPLFEYSDADLEYLALAHADLQTVAHRAEELAPKYIPRGFMIDRHVARTLDEQKALVAAGKSHTLKSRHIIRPPAVPLSRAVDAEPLIAHGIPSWNWADYFPLAACWGQAAFDVKIPLLWGGTWARIDFDSITADQCRRAHEKYKADWLVKNPRSAARGKTAFVDGPHFELPLEQYP